MLLAWLTLCCWPGGSRLLALCGAVAGLVALCGAVAGLAGSLLVASSHVWNVRVQARGGLGEAREPEIRTRLKT